MMPQVRGNVPAPACVCSVDSYNAKHYSGRRGSRGQLDDAAAEGRARALHPEHHREEPGLRVRHRQAAPGHRRAGRQRRDDLPDPQPAEARWPRAHDARGVARRAGAKVLRAHQARRAAAERHERVLGRPDSRHFRAEKGVEVMVTLSRDAQGHLERYLRQVKAALRGHPSVDAGEIERDVLGHIDAELSGQPETLGEGSLREVLARLGAPDAWVPADELPAWRRVWLRMRSGPEDWRLAYLTLTLFLGGVTLFLAGPVLWPLPLMCLLAALLLG